jgi:hypothetical protein
MIDDIQSPPPNNQSNSIVLHTLVACDIGESHGLQISDGGCSSRILVLGSRQHSCSQMKKKMTTTKASSNTPPPRRRFGVGNGPP